MEGEEDLDEDRLAEEGEDADDEDDDMEAEHQQHHHQQQQQQHLEVDTDCVSEVAAAVVPRVLYEELVHSYRQQEEEMRRLQQELERTRRQLVQQAKKLKEYGSLLTEVKELRDFNRRLQDVLLMRLGSGERPGACTPTHIPLLPLPQSLIVTFNLIGPFEKLSTKIKSVGTDQEYLCSSKTAIWGLRTLSF